MQYLWMKLLSYIYLSQKNKTTNKSLVLQTSFTKAASGRCSAKKVLLVADRAVRWMCSATWGLFPSRKMSCKSLSLKNSCFSNNFIGIWDS